MGNMSGSYGSHYTLWQSITENSVNVANNTSNITVNLYLKFDGSSYYAYTNYITNGSMTINGNTYNYSINPITFNSGQAKDVLLASWTGDIAHNSDGTKTLVVSANWNTDTSRIGSGSCSASKILTTINKALNINSFTLQSRGLNTLTFKWTTDKSCNALYFDYFNSSDKLLFSSANQINGQSSSGSFTVTGLQPNTTYKVRIRPSSSDGTSTTSSKITATTYDIAKISSVSNFEHGSNTTISITNPASISSLNLVMKVGDIQILSRTVISGSNTITFSDTELDNIYKKYGTGNSLMLTFILSGSGYTNSKTVTITFKR